MVLVVLEMVLVVLGDPWRLFGAVLVGGLGEVCFWPVRTYVRSTYPLVCGLTSAHSQLGALWASLGLTLGVLGAFLGRSLGPKT